LPGPLLQNTVLLQSRRRSLPAFEVFDTHERETCNPFSFATRIGEPGDQIGYSWSSECELRHTTRQKVRLNETST